MEETDKDQAKRNYKALDRIGMYLSKRDHSELELRQKLREKFEDPEIEWAINEAKERKWIGNPEELAQRVAQSLISRGKGRLYISQYLRKKGLPLVEVPEESQLVQAQELAGRKFGSVADLSFKEKQKVGRFLISRGFDNNIVKKVIYEEF